MSTPRINVAIIAPKRDLMCFDAHIPNAAEPPARFISATIMPSTTRKINIPDCPSTAVINPSLTIASIVESPPNEVDKSPPTTIPINKEE